MEQSRIIRAENKYVSSRCWKFPTVNYRQKLTHAKEFWPIVSCLKPPPPTTYVFGTEIVHTGIYAKPQYYVGEKL